MFDTPALMQALEEFKVRANAPLPPMSERLLEEAWHGSILHDTVHWHVCNAEAYSSDDDGGPSSDEEIAVDSEDGSESDDDADSDDEADVQVSAEEDSEESEDEMVKVVKRSFVVHTTYYHSAPNTLPSII
jgi:hypothetical protein